MKMDVPFLIGGGFRPRLPGGGVGAAAAAVGPNFISGKTRSSFTGAAGEGAGTEDNGRTNRTGLVLVFKSSGRASGTEKRYIKAKLLLLLLLLLQSL